MNYVEYDEKMLQEFEYETTIQNPDGEFLGVCELGKATIQLINEENNYSSFKGSWIQTPLGSLYIYDVHPIQEKVNIKLDCYDIKYKLDTPYDSSKHVFPCTLKEWRNSIFNSCDVEYDNADFPYSDMILNEEPYVGNKPSNRNVISLIAQAGLSIVITDYNDKFYFSWFSDSTHNIDDWLELTTEKNLSNPVNTVVLGRGDVEDNVYYPLEKPVNHTEFRIDNNYILDPQNGEEDKRYDLISTFYNRLNGFQYLIFNIRSQKLNNKKSVKLGEKIKFIDIWDNELIAPIMSKKLKWLGGDFNSDENYEITLSALEIKETSTNYKYASNIKNDFLKVERLANKTAGEIKDVIEKTIDIENELNSSSITNNNSYQELLNRLDKVPSQEDVISLKNKVENIKNSTESITNVIETIKVNGVDKVVTETGVKIDIEGLHIDQSEAPVSQTHDAYGQTVVDKSDNSILLFAGYDKNTKETIVKSKNMTIEQYLNIPRSRFEAYENPLFGKGTGAFFVDN